MNAKTNSNNNELTTAMEQAIAKKYIDKIDVTHIPKTTAVFTNYLNI